MPAVIGLDADEAERILTRAGFAVRRVLYESRRGVPEADSSRVIRQRAAGGDVEIVVADFKTRIGPEQE